MTIQISRSKTKNIQSNALPVIGSAGNLIMQADSMDVIHNQIGVGRKNIFHNGKCQVAQRLFAANIPASSNGYHVDGWKQQHANHTYIRDFDTSLNCHYLQMQRSDDSVTTALVYGVAEAYPGVFVNGEVYTVSFLYSGTGLNFGAFFRVGSAGANIVTQVSTVTLPANEGNWARYEVSFVCTGKVDAHTAFNMRFGSYNTDTFRVTQLQIEKGNRATPFEHRSYNEELHACQRYAYVCHVLGGGVYNSGTQFFASQQFPTDMRVLPAFSMLSTGGGQYGTINIEHDDNYTINAINLSHAVSHSLSKNNVVVTMERSAQGGAAQGQGGVAVIDNSNTQAFVFSAEL